MYINSNLSCCGLREISSLGEHRTAIAAMRAFCNHIYGGHSRRKFRYAIFTEAARGMYGQRFMAYILKNNLGEVVQTTKNVNPNSGNQLVAYMWTVNHDTLEKWAVKQKIGICEEPDSEYDYDDEWCW